MAGKTAMTSAARDIPAWLDLTIAQIASSEVNVSLEALAQFEEVFKRHSEEPEVIKKIDQVKFSMDFLEIILFDLFSENFDWAIYKLPLSL